MLFTISFLNHFLATAYLVSPLLITLSLVIIGLGQVVGHLEKWSRFDAIYWSLITATTVGFGDFKPTHKLAKALSIVIAICGVIFTGILVSVAVESTSFTMKAFQA